MLERPLVYLVPAATAALYCAVCLGFAPGQYLSLILLSVFLFSAGALVHHDRLLTLMGMLAAAAFAFAGFSLFQSNVVEPVRALAERDVYKRQENYLDTPGGDFARIDMNGAHDALELLHELG